MFKLTSVKMGCIKGDGNIEKNREFSGKKTLSDSSKSSLNELGIKASQFTAFRFYASRIYCLSSDVTCVCLIYLFYTRRYSGLKTTLTSLA